MLEDVAGVSDQVVEEAVLGGRQVEADAPEARLLAGEVDTLTNGFAVTG